MEHSFYRYFSVTQEDSRWGIFVTSAGRSRVAAGADYPQPDHPEGYHFEWKRGRVLEGFAMVYIARGQGVFQSPSAPSLNLKRGDVVLVPPGYLHRYRPARATGWEEYWVTFDGSVPRGWHAQNLFLKRWPLLARDLPPTAVERFDDLLSVARQEYYSPQLLASLAQAILFEAFASSGKERTLVTPEARLRQSAEAVRRHPTQMDVPGLAALADMPLSSFRRAFSREFGMPPAKYIQQERIALAKRWLAETPLTIREIAARMAFSSEYYFMRSFKRSTGQTPGQWRSIVVPSHTPEKP